MKGKLMSGNIYTSVMDRLNTPARLTNESFLELYEGVVGRYDEYVRSVNLLPELREDIWAHLGKHRAFKNTVPPALTFKYLTEKQMNVAVWIWVFEEMSSIRLINDDGTPGGIMAALAKGENSWLAQHLVTPEDWMELQLFIQNNQVCSQVRKDLGMKFLGRGFHEGETPTMTVIARVIRLFGFDPLRSNGEPMKGRGKS